jgi:hypothetical protein
MDRTQNGLNLEWTQPRMNSTTIGLNPDWDLTPNGLNTDWDSTPNGLNSEWDSTSNFYQPRMVQFQGLCKKMDLKREYNNIF